MRTEKLTAILAANIEPIASGRPQRRWAIGIIAGALGALVFTGGILRVNPALNHEVFEVAFWVRELYCASLAVLATRTAARLARPGAALGLAPWGIAAVVTLMWVLAARTLLIAPWGDGMHLLLGKTFAVCPFLISSVSAPLLLANLWILKGLAPTRLRWAGAGAGFAAGSIGALVYTLHCPELAPPFIGAWYLLGMLFPTAIGALLAPRLLRW